MASISQLENGKFRVRIYVKGQKISRNFASKELAEKFASEAEAQMQGGEQVLVPGDPSITVNNVIAKFKDDVPFLKLVESTRKSCLSKLKAVANQFGRRTIMSITSKDVLKWDIDMTDRGLSEDTRRLRLIELSKVFKYAIEDLRLPLKENPVKKIDLPKGTPKGKILDPEDEAVLIQLCTWSDDRPAYLGRPDPELARLVRLAILSMARAGELTTLRWINIDRSRAQSNRGENGVIHFLKTKNGDNRTIPIDDEMNDLLIQQKKFQNQKMGKGCPYVFASRDEDGNFIPYVYGSKWRKLKEWWELYCENYEPYHTVKSNDPSKLRFHDLRHTGITRTITQLQHLTTDAQIMKWTGHKVYAQYLRYFKPNTDLANETYLLNKRNDHYARAPLQRPGENKNATKLRLYDNMRKELENAKKIGMPVEIIQDLMETMLRQIDGQLE